ncbi:hypothetical protein QF025_000540 [Paraburkholderia graminis]|uniref:Uncharacterized protein n=1 Tax=Paraburkholderia graminis TaxID=60548 RepID=A0ABD5C9A5_9BURK|nr:hypothetical protein [Paraburkholderia graminis]
MRGESEIVIARKADDLAAVDRHMRRARRVDGAAATAQTVFVDLLESLRKFVEQMH